MSGKLITHEYKVEGPVMIFLTTTEMEIDEELLNRCIVLTVNEDREQTQAIHRIQREAQTIEGLLRSRDRDELLKLHQNAQRLLRPLAVVNELAPELSFLDGETRTRRDHTKYLALIHSIALLHQWQRQPKTGEHRGKTFEYIEATLDDIDMAKKIIHEVLGRSLDEMSAQTRKLLLMVDAMVRAECERQRIERAEYRFSRRDVRGFTRWGDSQLSGTGRLEELEYLMAHRGGRGQSFVYELFLRGRRGRRSQGHADGHEHDVRWREVRARGARSRGQVRPRSGGCPGVMRVRESPVSIGVQGTFYERELKNTIKETTEENPVVVVPPRVKAAERRGASGGHAMARVEKKRKPQAAPATPLEALMREHLRSLEVRNYSEFTVKGRAGHIQFFLEWLKERGITEPVEVTRPVLERYQRHLFYSRKKNGEPLSFSSQHARLVPLRVWFRWMTQAESHPA